MLERCVNTVITVIMRRGTCFPEQASLALDTFYNQVVCFIQWVSNMNVNTSTNLDWSKRSNVNISEKNLPSLHFHAGNNLGILIVALFCCCIKLRMDCLIRTLFLWEFQSEGRPIITLFCYLSSFICSCNTFRCKHIIYTNHYSAYHTCTTPYF